VLAAARGGRKPGARDGRKPGKYDCAFGERKVVNRIVDNNIRIPASYRMKLLNN
jgi:hypothetical protein